EQRGTRSGKSLESTMEVHEEDQQHRPPAQAFHGYDALRAGIGLVQIGDTVQYAHRCLGRCVRDAENRRVIDQGHSSNTADETPTLPPCSGLELISYLVFSDRQGQALARAYDGPTTALVRQHLQKHRGDGSEYGRAQETTT